MILIRKRIGNDIKVTITTDTALEDNLYEVFIIKRFGPSWKMDATKNGISLASDNMGCSFVWKASQQPSVGDYSILLKRYTESLKESGQSEDYAQAIYLTQHTNQATDSTNEITIDFSI